MCLLQLQDAFITAGLSLSSLLGMSAFNNINDFVII